MFPHEIRTVALTRHILIPRIMETTEGRARRKPDKFMKMTTIHCETMMLHHYNVIVTRSLAIINLTYAYVFDLFGHY